MIKFIKPPIKYLKESYTGNENIPSFYWSDNLLIRILFWNRLKCLINNIPMCCDPSWAVMDLGCGGGALMPTLANYFFEVDGVDLYVDEITCFIHKMGLINVRIFQSDLIDFKSFKKYNLIIAADVLEHIMELDSIVDKIYDMLFDGGYLCVIIPTENILYNITRKFFHIKKPGTHFHHAEIIEKCLKNKFVNVEKKVYEPLPLKSLCQFMVLIMKK